jgi:hypothetical protein
VTNDPIGEMRAFLIEAVRQSPDIERQADDLMGEFADRLAGPVARPLAAGAGPAARMDAGMRNRFLDLIWNLAGSHRGEMAMPEVIQTTRTQVAQLLADLVPVLTESAEVVDQAIAIAADPEITEGLEKTSAKVGRAGVVGMSSGMILLLVFIWLAAVGLPIAQAELPATGQDVATNEIATIALALAVTWRILDKRAK